MILSPLPMALGASTNTTWQAVGISEFMATNRTTVLDVDGDPSGWIEIFNPTTNDISLSGWSLTDDPNNLRQWLFPNVVIPDAGDANGSDNFLVVFASGKNRATNTAELHSNFKLPLTGGYLALVDNKTNVVSVFTNYPAQSPDISYGRDPFNPNFAGFFSATTPVILIQPAAQIFHPPSNFPGPAAHLSRRLICNCRFPIAR